jgi:murein DD-endopeptidase MepM/ murein hydrolase activator NlpD
MWLIELIKKILLLFTDKGKALQKQQNSWNPPEAEKNSTQISKSETFEKVDGTFSTIPPIPLVLPVERVPVVVTSPFGERFLQGKKQFHIGVDFKTIDSRRVRAVEKGVIKKVLGPDKEYPVRFVYRNGKFVDPGIPKGRAWTPYIVLVGHYTKNMYVYKHVTSDVKPGDLVECGQIIGMTGNLGYCMGEHLHFEYYDWLEKENKWSDPKDPIIYFRKMGLDLSKNVKVELSHGQLEELIT